MLHPVCTSCRERPVAIKSRGLCQSCYHRWWRTLPKGSRRHGSAEPTPAELEVLRLIADGLSNREIAERLSLSRGGVECRIQCAFKRLGVHSRIRAVNAVRGML